MDDHLKRKKSAQKNLVIWNVPAISIPQMDQLAVYINHTSNKLPTKLIVILFPQKISKNKWPTLLVAYFNTIIIL